MTFDILAHVDAKSFFADESRNWHYCVKWASFAHREMCEFILPLYRSGETEADSYHAYEVQRMKDFGCTAEFIQAYEDARKTGASRVLFYA